MRTVLSLLLIAIAWPAHGVIFEVTGDVGYNTNAPTGALAASGWQYQGRWGDYLGTPIAPRFFITAKHVGGSTNDVLLLDDVAFHPVRYWDSPTADLRIWETAETLPRYAPLFTATNETGKTCIVFGRGTRRGTEVIISSESKGWRWGATDRIQRWGSNAVDEVVNGGAGVGELLRCEFNRGAGSNECHLSVGDSSGALFIEEAGMWKLAGLHYSVDGPFSNAVDGSTFNAALLDRGGLFEEGALVPDTLADKPSAFYSTRIAANLAWITGIIDYHTGSDLRFTGVVSFPTATGRVYRVETTTNLTGAVWTVWTNVAGTGGTVTLTDTNAANLLRQFYRLGLDR
jgi:hypothetical protein